tara:strand:+ start:24489 stop:24938 length:450 start_codon:yes stop_codon:yes gene_type:complete
MKQLEKYAAVQRALKLMSQPGGKGRRFFQDLMERQKGLNDFSPYDQMHLLKGLAGEGGGVQSNIALLKRILRQGSSYADDFTHVNGMIPRITDINQGPGGASISSREQLLRNRHRQLDASDGHRRAVRRQQEGKRNYASEMDRLLNYLG